MYWSEPGSRPVSDVSDPGGKSELRMAAGSDGRVAGYRRRGDPTESATENRPPRNTYVFRSKGEKAGQEPTGPAREYRVHGKPPAEQDQIREDSRLDSVRSGASRPVSPADPITGNDSRVGCLRPAAMLGPDKWLPLPAALSCPGKTEFGLSAHSINFDKN